MTTHAVWQAAVIGTPGSYFARFCDPNVREAEKPSWSDVDCPDCLAKRDHALAQIAQDPTS